MKAAYLTAVTFVVTTMTSSVAHSAMLGEYVQLTYREPTKTSVRRTWNFTVSPNTEAYNGYVSIDVSDNGITFYSTGATGYVPFEFHGYVLSDPFNNLPDFQSVTGPDWFLAEGRVTVERDNVYFDFGGRGITNTGISFGIVTVPEPSAALLALSGGVMFVRTRRSRERSSADAPERLSP